MTQSGPHRPPTPGALLGEILPVEERAIESVVARYQRVAGAVTRVARTLTGREELRVTLGSSSRAEGDEVVIDPGLFQAAYGRRAPVTPEETALASALHEVIHLVSTDLGETRPLPPEWEPAPPPGPAPDGEPGETGQAEEPEEPNREPMTLLEALHAAGGPPAEALFFAVEDARQEHQGLAAYPGAYSVLEDLYRASLDEALPGRGAAAQFAVACFMLVGNYAAPGYMNPLLRPEVAEALEEAAPLLAAAAAADDPWETAGLALRLLDLARRRGLASAGGGEGEGDRSRQEAEREAMADGLDRVRLMSPVVSDADSYEETRRGGEAMASRNGERREHDEGTGEEGVEQLLTVSQAPMVYLPTGQGGKLVVGPVPDAFRGFAPQGRAALMEAARSWQVDQRRVSGELFPLFAANQRRGLRSGYDAGDLSPYSALLLGGGLYQRMFERRSRSTRRSYAVSVLVDGSASMLQPRRLASPGDRQPWGLSAAMLGAWTLAGMCNELQVDFEVSLFNRAFAAKADDTEWTYSRRRSAAAGQLRQTRGEAAKRLTSTVNHYLLSSFDQPWRRTEDVLAGLFWAAARTGEASMAARRAPRECAPVSMFENAANVDEFNLTYAAGRLSAHRARVSVMVVLADGMTRGSVENLSRAVAEIDDLGITVLGIGVGDDTVVAAYPRHQVVTRPHELAASMVDGVRLALRRGLALFGEDRWWSGACRAGTGDAARPGSPHGPPRPPGGRRPPPGRLSSERAAETIR